MCVGGQRSSRFSDVGQYLHRADRAVRHGDPRTAYLCGNIGLEGLGYVGRAIDDPISPTYCSLDIRNAKTPGSVYVESAMPSNVVAGERGFKLRTSTVNGLRVVSYEYAYGGSSGRRDCYRDIFARGVAVHLYQSAYTTTCPLLDPVVTKLTADITGGQIKRVSFAADSLAFRNMCDDLRAAHPDELPLARGVQLSVHSFGNLCRADRKGLSVEVEANVTASSLGYTWVNYGGHRLQKFSGGSRSTCAFESPQGSYKRGLTRYQEALSVDVYLGGTPWTSEEVAQACTLGQQVTARMLDALHRK